MDAYHNVMAVDFVGLAQVVQLRDANDAHGLVAQVVGVLSVEQCARFFKL